MHVFVNNIGKVRRKGCTGDWCWALDVTCVAQSAGGMSFMSPTSMSTSAGPQFFSTPLGMSGDQANNSNASTVPFPPTPQQQLQQGSPFMPVPIYNMQGASSIPTTNKYGSVKSQTSDR